MADMTIEQLDELQAALTDEFELREKWRALATSSAAENPPQGRTP